ncbi:MAG TPA: acetyl-CoA carboxylase biotin carboxyl carrier protein [Acidobacteria bacterium]|nr:acetyl-CoA carboxylase biotin carboxyl carrier protein [Acidobacteriota bacterium]
MFKFEEICELIRLVSSTGLASVEIEHGGSRVKIEGAGGVAVSSVPAVPVVQGTVPRPTVVAPGSPVLGAPPSAAEGESQEEAGGEDLHYVTSPIVGTFYRAPNPDADPYVKVGDFVERGQVLCIVEAMKLMNEIEADFSGTIVKVFPENGQPVEFGERLFAIKPA